MRRAAGHIAHVVPDGGLRRSLPVRRVDGVDANAIDRPEAASIFRRLVEQPSQAWTHELELRPNGGRFRWTDC